MLEYLKLLISVIKPVLDGIRSASNTIKAERRKDIQRRILEIHLLLVDIIDSANSLLSLVKTFANKPAITKDDINLFRFFLNMQRGRLEVMDTLIQDPTSKHMMDIFAPSTRMQFMNTMSGKVSAIGNIIIELDNYLYKDYSETLPKYELELSLINFYLPEYGINSLAPITHHEISVYDRIEEQDSVVSELISCSRQLSELIRDVISFDDIISYLEH
jgi:hypothetical protein